MELRIDQDDYEEDEHEDSEVNVSVAISLIHHMHHMHHMHLTPLPVNLPVYRTLLKKATAATMTRESSGPCHPICDVVVADRQSSVVVTCPYDRQY